MANYADYLPGGKNDPSNPGGGLDTEIDQAGQQQQARAEETPTVSATPENIDWEKRYKELEKLNSRQAQDLGTYRKMVDEYITNPTPTPEPVVAEESQPITVDDLYDNPDEAIQRAVASHPAIKEAQKIKEDLARQEHERNVARFMERHPDAQQIGADPAFVNWVQGDPMHVALFQRGNEYDLEAADALMSLYKAENNISQMTAEQQQASAVAAATLEESSAVMTAPTAEYSRSEYVDKLMRARQGDMEADRWVKANASGYREALASGNVRD